MDFQVKEKPRGSCPPNPPLPQGQPHLRQHTTHFDDCGCLTARKDAEIAALTTRVTELETLLDIATGKAVKVHTGLYDSLRTMVEPSSDDKNDPMDSNGRAIVCSLAVHSMQYLNDERKRTATLKTGLTDLLDTFESHCKDRDDWCGDPACPKCGAEAQLILNTKKLLE